MKINKNSILLLALVVATIFMGIGYSAINSITGDIKGKATANNQDGVFITDVEYVSDIDANLNNSKIENFLGTMMKSTVKLSESNTKSEIKYKVTIYNNAIEAAVFEKVTYGKEFYDNEGIIYEIEGFTPGQTIGSKETKEIIITFKYKDQTTVPANKILNSYLNFEMIVPNRMVLAKSVTETGKYLTGSILKNQIESVKFKKGEEPTSTDILAKFDASEKQDESIIGYYTDTDNNGLYELTFISNKTIFPNKSAQYLFSNLNNVQSFEFDNFSTIGTTSFLGMFQGCNKITALDLNNWDVSKVTEFGHSGWSYGGTFEYCTNLKELNIENWNTESAKDISNMFSFNGSLTKLNVNNLNTSSVTAMYAVFLGCNNLTELDLSKWNTSKVTTMDAMFGNCNSLTNLDLSNWNTENLKSVVNMFQYCFNLVSVKLDNLKTDKITNMQGMFHSCRSLTEINLSGFDTKSVTNTVAMFQQCTNLKTIYVKEYDSTNNTGWTTSAVTNSTNMFLNCGNIVGGNGTKFDTTYKDATYARIDTAGTPGYLTNINNKN